MPIIQYILMCVIIIISAVAASYSIQNYNLVEKQFEINNPLPQPTTESVVIYLDPGINISRINFTKPFMLNAVGTEHDLKFTLLDAKIDHLGSYEFCLYEEKPKIDLRHYDSKYWAKENGPVKLEPEWFFMNYKLKFPFNEKVNPEKDVIFLSAGGIVFTFDVEDIQTQQHVHDEVFGSLVLPISHDDQQKLDDCMTSMKSQ